MKIPDKFRKGGRTFWRLFSAGNLHLLFITVAIPQ
jgi:hypothetical protein